MRFKLDDHRHIINHWMLQQPTSVIHKLRETELWKEEKEFEARVFVNGIELEFEPLESYLKESYQKKVESVEARYEDAEATIQKAVEERLVSHHEKLIETMNDVMHSLRNAEDIIKPHWDRPIRSRKLEWVENINSNLDCDLIDSIYGMFQIVFEDDGMVSMVKCGEDTYTTYESVDAAKEKAQEIINGLLAVNATA